MANFIFLKVKILPKICDSKIFVRFNDMAHTIWGLYPVYYLFLIIFLIFAGFSQNFSLESFFIYFVQFLFRFTFEIINLINFEKI